MPANQSQYVDEAFADLAGWFAANPGDPTPGSDAIDPSRFDFSLESLGAMDEYLEKMRAREFDDPTWSKLVIRSGAYVGEVIRRHVLPRDWHWIDYHVAVRQSKLLADLDEGWGTIAVLRDDRGGFCFPLAKVCKYLEHGDVDSVAYFARVILAETADEA